MKQKYSEIIESFTGKNILVIGDVMVDSYLYGTVERISPEAPVPIVDVNRREQRPGGAANVAINIKQLGGNPIVCSVIGDDERGKILLNLFEQSQIKTNYIIKDKNRITTTKFRIIGNSFQLLRVDEEVKTIVDNSTTAQLIDNIKTIVKDNKIDTIIFQDYDKGVISETLIKQTKEIASQHKIPIIVDPKKRFFHHYTDVYLFKPNFKEFIDGIKTSIDIENTNALREKMFEFQKKQNIEKLMVTLSDKGIILTNLQSQNWFYVPTIKRQIADVSGAGDTVVSIAALCVASNVSDEDMIKICNIAGGIVCQYPGVYAISKEELINEINRLSL